MTPYNPEYKQLSRESLMATDLEVLLKEIPENRPLVKDSGLWQIESEPSIIYEADDCDTKLSSYIPLKPIITSAVICTQVSFESFHEFIVRYILEGYEKEPELFDILFV